MIGRRGAFLGTLCSLGSLTFAAAAEDPDIAGAREKVAHEVMDGFAQRDRQRVIVEIADPAADAFEPQRFWDRRQPRSVFDRRPVSASRRLTLEARKRQILEVLRKDLSPADARYEYPPFPLMALDLDRDEVAALARLEAVVAVRADHLNVAEVSSSIPFTGLDDLAGAGWGGAGTAVAVLDSAAQYWRDEFGAGCPAEGTWDPRPESQPLIPREDCAFGVWANFNRYSGGEDNDPHDIAAGLDHGTTISGILRAAAPEATLLSLNVFFRSSGGSYYSYDSDILAALAWLHEWSGSADLPYTVVAANISVGYDREHSSPCNQVNFYAPLRDLWSDRDIAVSASSGNDGTQAWIGKPACVTLGLGVGAQWDTELIPAQDTECEIADPYAGKVACISNLNGMLDFVAPGMLIRALSGGDYVSGTSFAAPHAAAAVALQQSEFLDTTGGTLPARSIHRILTHYQKTN